MDTNEAYFKSENVQNDLKVTKSIHTVKIKPCGVLVQCIIGGLLQLILDNQENPPLRPVYSDNIVVYPRIFSGILEFQINTYTNGFLP